MQLAERHKIKKKDTRFKEIDEVCFKAKNLYNKANYLVRQEFFNGDDGKFLPYVQVRPIANEWPEYKELPSKVAQMVLRTLEKNWKGFFAAKKDFTKNPTKYLGRPRPPKYLPKDGRCVAQYDYQTFSKTVWKQEGLLKLTFLGEKFSTNQKFEDIKLCRFVPKRDHYIFEVVYNVETKTHEGKKDGFIAGIDFGIKNLMTVAFNKADGQPFIVNGLPLKSINQFYNKEKAKLQAALPEGLFWTKKLSALTDKRNAKIDDYLHKASRLVVNELQSRGVSTLVIGRNKEWKQKVNMGKRNNQKFTYIPFYKLLRMLTYKCELVGIEVIEQEESHTSKCSFLDNEPIEHQEEYVGKRIKRGLFRSSDGTLINADLNGAYNIIKKAVPNAFADGIEGGRHHPTRATPL